MNLSNIIAHRGYWKKAEEKNTLAALSNAIKNGYGFETDFRDCKGEVLISHNPPIGNEITAEKVFEMYYQSGSSATLALNIKADGLQDMLQTLLQKYEIKNYFFFDMSVCDTILYADKGMTIATRISEYEQETPFWGESEFVWLDYFRKDPTEEEILKCLHAGKKVCIVSPDLHGRDYNNSWKLLKNMNDDNLYLCTDYPDEAKEYFIK